MDAPFPDGMMEDIEKFFALECTRSPGLDVYPSVFETALFFPLQRQAELAEMMREARKVSPRVVMEIGTDKGGGLYHWCKCLPTVRYVIACEIRGCPYKHLFEKNFPAIKFTWLERASLPPPKCPYPIDCLFIDGDKAGFALDFAAYRSLMSERGVVFLHDIQDRSPMRDTFLACKAAGYKTKEIIDTSDYKRVLGYPVKGREMTPHEAWLRYWRGTSCGVGCVYMPEHPGL